jgi:tRNA (guanine-N7-)-methyltransferase
MQPGRSLMLTLTKEAIMIDPPEEGVIVDPAVLFDLPGSSTSVGPRDPARRSDPAGWHQSSAGSFELEIGCGKGGFLLHRARANPHIRLLGIEWARRYYRYCADRLARWQVTNVRLMRTDAACFVKNHLAPGCVSVLHLYHPDPWPKKRHHKRRLVKPDFVDAVVRVLERGGRWLIQSDHQEYFGIIRGLLDRRGELVEIPWNGANASAGPDWAGTNFELKYNREGRTIHRAAYRLAEPAASL